MVYALFLYSRSMLCFSASLVKFSRSLGALSLLSTSLVSALYKPGLCSQQVWSLLSTSLVSALNKPAQTRLVESGDQASWEWRLGLLRTVPGLWRAKMKLLRVLRLCKPGFCSGSWQASSTLWFLTSHGLCFGSQQAWFLLSTSFVSALYKAGPCSLQAWSLLSTSLFSLSTNLV